MSRYKPYPEYKDSGVEWIGKIPQHWETKPIKRIVTCNDDSLDEQFDPTSTIRYVDISSVSLTEGIERSEEILFSDAPSRARRKAKEGDVVISTVRTYLKAVAQVSEQHADCVFSTGFAVLRAKKQVVYPPFLKWLSLNELLIQSIESNSKGLSYPAINATELVDLPSVLPSEEEQKIIAEVLDKETTRIDALIAKKTRFIELLKEKRQALITHAVTKGLSPNVQMKDSGVAWIGEVPEHWEIGQLKRLLMFYNGKDHKHVESTQEDGFPVYGSGGQFAYASDYLYDGESVLFGRKGTINKPLYLNEKFWTVDTMYWTKILSVAHGKFCFYVSKNIPFEYYATNTALPSMTQSELGSHAIAIPPRHEQVSIANTLDNQTSKIDSLIKKSQASIDLLKERRSAFITAAVTGQIDLRSEVGQ